MDDRVVLLADFMASTELIWSSLVERDSVRAGKCKLLIRDLRLWMLQLLHIFFSLVNKSEDQLKGRPYDLNLYAIPQCGFNSLGTLDLHYTRTIIS